MIDWNAEPIPNFTLKEARCKCGCSVIMLQITTLDSLHKVRSEYGKSIIVTSWARCKDWNAKVGGKADSYHLNGKAVDIKPGNSNDIDILETIAREPFAFVKRYLRENSDGSISEWLHCDIRGERPEVV